MSNLSDTPRPCQTCGQPITNPEHIGYGDCVPCMRAKRAEVRRRAFEASESGVVIRMTAWPRRGKK
jgi:hypothetical protein